MSGEKIILNGSEDEHLTEEQAGKHIEQACQAEKACKTQMKSEQKELKNKTEQLYQVSKTNIAQNECSFP